MFYFLVSKYFYKTLRAVSLYKEKNNIMLYKKFEFIFTYFIFI